MAKTQSITTAAVRTYVAAPREILAQWDEASNRLRIAVASTDETVAVFDNGQVYGLSAATPAGTVVIRQTSHLPEPLDLARGLASKGAVRVVKELAGPLAGDRGVLVEVLLDSI